LRRSAQWTDSGGISGYLRPETLAASGGGHLAAKTDRVKHAPPAVSTSSRKLERIAQLADRIAVGVEFADRNRN
jgi:hypothetical protein